MGKLYLGSQAIAPTRTITVQEPAIIPREITSDGTLQFVGEGTFGTVDYKFDDSIKRINRGAFAGAFFRDFALRSLDFNNVEVIERNGCALAAFSANRLATINFSNIKELGEGAFQQAFATAPCSTFTFTSLEKIGKEAFLAFIQTHIGSATLSFPALKPENFQSDNGCFTDMLKGMMTGTYTVHFPSNFQAIIGSWNDVVGGFGYSKPDKVNVLFDLPAST